MLPFENMSSNPENTFMADGIAEELLNLLAQIPEVNVTSRSSAFAYRDSDLTIGEIAAELGVAHVLQGSVREAGDIIRITAQLIEAESDANLFSLTFDRAPEDLFAIQDEVAAD